MRVVSREDAYVAVESVKGSWDVRKWSVFVSVKRRKVWSSAGVTEQFGS